MKKILKTVLPLCLLLAVLATAFAFGASAKTVDNSVYYGVYATTAPTVDGEIDEIWNSRESDRGYSWSVSFFVA